MENSNQQDPEGDKGTFINIIINNNNNNNYMVNQGISKLSKPLKPQTNRLSLVPAEQTETANQFLLDFTHKYDKKIYCHRKHLKELTYPDVPPNSFNFDSFDVSGFLESIKQLQENSHIPQTQNLNIMTIDDGQFMGQDSQYLPHQLNSMMFQQQEENTCSIGPQEIKQNEFEKDINSKDAFEKEPEIKKFETCKDMKENATLQLRKIKFFWRGTQTNLPYIFKKIIIEKNIETGENEMFEKFEYSKKKIKTSGNEN